MQSCLLVSMIIFELSPYNGAFLYCSPERYNFWSDSHDSQKLQKLIILQRFRDNLEISEHPSVDSFDFEKYGRFAGRNGKTANIIFSRIRLGRRR